MGGSCLFIEGRVRGNGDGGVGERVGVVLWPGENVGVGWVRKLGGVWGGGAGGGGGEGERGGGGASVSSPRSFFPSIDEGQRPDPCVLI